MQANLRALAAPTRALLRNSNKIIERRLLSTTACRCQTVKPVATKKHFFYRKAANSVLQVTLASLLLGTGYISYSLYRESHPKAQQPQTETFPDGRPRKTLVILGSGWGSVSLLKSLDTTLYNVIVISPRNYFLFTPFLPSTPVGTVDLKSIVEPMRSIVRRSQGEVKYVEAEATDIDPITKEIKIEENHGEIKTSLKYDYLVVAVGSQPTTFGIPGVKEHSSFLKEVSDAKKIREKILENLELASNLSEDDPKRKRLLSFVVVGGGPTGVEFAAELKDYVDQDLTKWMPKLSKEIRVTLVEGTPNILGSFDKKLIKYAEDTFNEEHIDLQLRTRVKSVNCENVQASFKSKW